MKEDVSTIPRSRKNDRHVCSVVSRGGAREQFCSCPCFVWSSGTTPRATTQPVTGVSQQFWECHASASSLLSRRRRHRCCSSSRSWEATHRNVLGAAARRCEETPLFYPRPLQQPRRRLQKQQQERQGFGPGGSTHLASPPPPPHRSNDVPAIPRRHATPPMRRIIPMRRTPSGTEETQAV